MQTEPIDDWKKDEVVLYCRSGNRSGQATMILEQLGFEHVKNLVEQNISILFNVQQISSVKIISCT